MTIAGTGRFGLGAAACSLLLGAIFSTSAFAQTTSTPMPDDSWNAISDYGRWESGNEWRARMGGLATQSVDSVFGERIDLYDGGVQFTATDISIPGTGPEVAFRRSFSVSAVRETDYGVDGRFGGLANWNIDLPNISSVAEYSTGWTVDAANKYARCSSGARPPATMGFQAEEYWSGYQLNIPGQNSGELLRNNSGKRPTSTLGAYPWTTKAPWIIGCLSATKNNYPGEGFVAVSPNGTRYYFDWVISRNYPGLIGKQYYSSIDNRYRQYKMGRLMVYIMASRVVDRFGNWVNYNYSGDKLISITGNNAAGTDPRSITVAFTGELLTSVTGAGKTYRYAYAGPGLSTVSLPDGSSWTYTSTGSLVTDSSDQRPTSMSTCRHHPSGGGPFTYGITAPSGAHGEFAFSFLPHGRVNVPRYCEVWLSGTYSQPSSTSYFAFWKISPRNQSYTLTRKDVTGPGLTPMTWVYEYGGKLYGQPTQFSDNCSQDPSVCPLTKTVTVTGPDSVDSYQFGVWYGVNDRQLLVHERGPVGGPVLEHQEFTYVSQSEASQLPFGDSAGGHMHAFSDALPSQNRPQREKIIIRNGDRFVERVDVFDVFSRPTQVTRQSFLAN